MQRTVAFRNAQNSEQTHPSQERNAPAGNLAARGRRSSLQLKHPGDEGGAGCFHVGQAARPAFLWTGTLNIGRKCES
jgi:hypothetical protein